MKWTLWHWELVPWCVFLSYWFISALRLKQTKREEPSAGRLLHIEFGETYEQHRKRSGFLVRRLRRAE